MDINDMNDQEILRMAAKINGRKGGLVGGKAKWVRLTPEERTNHVRKMTDARLANKAARKAKKEQSNG